MTLDQILGTIALPLEHDGLSFQLVPFNNVRARAWNRATFHEKPDDVSELDHVEAIQGKQLDVLVAHMRDCVVDGDAKRVTAKWVGEKLPMTVVVDLAEFFKGGSRPAWAGESGN